jgi:hypothetical protein
MNAAVLLGQIGGGQDMLTTVLWFLMFFVFAFFYPRIMISQTIWSVEKDVLKLEDMARRDRDFVTKSIEARPSAKLKESVRNFMEFFAVPPVSDDPYGVIKKLDLVIRQSDGRFKWFVNQIGPRMSEVEKADIKNALAGAMTTHQIAKVLRHMLELIKKYKILQLAMIVQMQMPLIMRSAKAASNATKAFAEGVPIGDGIGPMVAASMTPAKAKLTVYKDEEFVVSKVNIGGRPVLMAKAHGPGASIGRPGAFLLKLIEKQKIDRIITVDAAMRLEGEKAGSVAEGVGVAMGGSVDRYEMEELAVKNQIPLDAVAIKVSDEEALNPMIKPVLSAIPVAQEAVRTALGRTKRSERILIMGVGNTCGVGDTAHDLEESKRNLLKVLARIEHEKGKKNKKEETE